MSNYMEVTEEEHKLGAMYDDIHANIIALLAQTLPCATRQIIDNLSALASALQVDVNSYECDMLNSLVGQMLNIESKCVNQEGLELFKTLLNVFHYFVKIVFGQRSKFRNLSSFVSKQIEKHLMNLRGVDAKDVVEEGAMQLCSYNKLNDIKHIQNHAGYVYHYEAFLHGSMSKVLVVLWRESVETRITHLLDGMPVIYVAANLPQDAADCRGWDDQPQLSVPSDLGPEQMKNLNQINEIISEHHRNLFERHSNLIAIRPKVLKDSEDIVIEFIVPCKRFIPVVDRNGPLPKQLCGVKTIVTKGWMQYYGKKQLLKQQQVLASGCAIAPSKMAYIVDGDKPSDHGTFCTMGGALISNGSQYGVTCGHCMLDDAKKAVVYEKSNSEVYQPSGLSCLIGKLMQIGEAGTYDSNKALYGSKKSLAKCARVLGEHYDTKVTTEDLIKQCNAEVAPIGRLQGGILGKNVNIGFFADVALVKLENHATARLFETHYTIEDCVISNSNSNNNNDSKVCDVKVVTVVSPSMILNMDDPDTVNQAVDIDTMESMNTSRMLYGRGARSKDISRVRLNPNHVIYVRDLFLDKMSIANVFYAEVLVNSWHPGDCGTWFWGGDVNDNMCHIGMGFACIHIDSISYCLIQPMKQVLQAAHQILHK